MEQGGRGGEEGGVCWVCVRHETLGYNPFGISVWSWTEAGNFRVDGISVQPCFYFIKQLIEIFFALSFQGAFPHDKDTPACLPQRFVSACVPCLVVFEFPDPEILVGIRDFEARTVVCMPEATVHEYGGLVFREHDIGMSGQFSGMYPITISSCKQSFADIGFDGCVFSFDFRHDPTSCRRVHSIGHSMISMPIRYGNAGILNAE